MAELRLPISNVPAGGDYTAAFKLGSTGAEVQLLLDTGSSSLGVVPVPGHYDPDADTDLTGTDYAQDVIYGTGGWAGPVIETKVQIGDVVLPKAYVALIDAQYEGFGTADGIIGLAYNRLNPAFNIGSYLRAHGKQASYPWPFKVRNSRLGIRWLLRLLSRTPVEDLAAYFTALDSTGEVANVFAFYTLRSSPSLASQDPVSDPLNKGWFVLGGGPEQKGLYEGSFEKVAVVDDVYYNVELLAVQVGAGEETRVPAQAGEEAPSNAIVDSGTNLLPLNSAAYDALFNGLVELNSSFREAIEAGSTRQGFDQSQLNLDDWPPISFILRGSEADDVKLECAPSTYWQLDAPAAGRAAFKLADAGASMSILGLPLFNNYYTVFERSDDRTGVVSFAKLKAGQS